MPNRRRLNADYNKTETATGMVFVWDTISKIGSISREKDGKWDFVTLADSDLDDLYEALKKREAHKQFLATKYGANA
jgi:hypothetical protein